MEYIQTSFHRLLSVNIKRYRQQNLMEIHELALKCGISSEEFSNIEDGKVFPEPEVLDKLTTALRIKPSQLFYSDNDAPDSSYNLFYKNCQEPQTHKAALNEPHKQQ
jgi:transcriptional regulator with XRE-family HTH domain